MQFPNKTEFESAGSSGAGAGGACSGEGGSRLNRAMVMFAGHKVVEWGYVMRSKCGRLVLFVEQELPEVRAAWQGALEQVTRCGWDRNDIVMVFKTCRSSDWVQPSLSVDGNVVLLTQEHLERYLGPTAWAMLASSEALARDTQHSRAAVGDSSVISTLAWVDGEKGHMVKEWRGRLLSVAS